MLHQVEGVDWMLKREQTPHHGILGGILQGGPGTGKTLQGLLLAFSKLDPLAFTLVVMPRAILQRDRAWRSDLVTFIRPDVQESRVLLYHTSNPAFKRAKHGSSSVEKMTPSQLRASTYRLVLTTYDRVGMAYAEHKDALNDLCRSVKGPAKTLLPRLHSGAVHDDESLGLLHGMAWDRIIFDESHHFANPKTRTFRSVITLNARLRWALTGTWFRNCPLDKWAQLRAIGYTQGAEFPREWSNDPDKVRTRWQKEGLDAIIRFESYKRAAIPMPPRHEHVVSVQLNPTERALYDETEQALEEAWQTWELKDADYAVVLLALLKMRMGVIAPALLNTETVRALLASHAAGESQLTALLDRAEDTQLSPAELIKAVDGPGGTGSSKIQAVVRQIEHYTDMATNGAKGLVFSQWSTVLQLLKLALEKQSYVQNDSLMIYYLDGTIIDDEERTVIQQAFRQHNGAAVLLITSKLGGEGWSAVEATFAIKVEPDWTPANADQHKHRIWRIGQTQPVHWVEMMVDDSIESFVLQVCQNKVQLDRYTGGRDLKRKKNFTVGLNRETLRVFLKHRQDRMDAAHYSWLAKIKAEEEAKRKKLAAEMPPPPPRPKPQPRPLPIPEAFLPPLPPLSPFVRMAARPPGLMLKQTILAFQPLPITIPRLAAPPEVYVSLLDEKSDEEEEDQKMTTLLHV
jgi:SNF2 family DNA or RNA helicase